MMVAPSTLSLTVADPRHFPKWDEEVGRFEAASFFHSRGWGATLLDTYGFTPRYLVAKREGRITGVLPLIETNSPLTGRRGVSLPFTDDCAPLAEDAETMQFLQLQAREVAVQNRWKYWEQRLPDAGDGPDKAIGLPGESVQAKFYTHRVPLEGDEPSLFKRICESTRRAIKKASRSGVTVTVRTDEGGIDAYYRLHCIARKGHGLPPQTRGFFRRLHAESIAKGNGCVILASVGDKPVAGAVYLAFGRVATYKFGASLPAFLPLRPNQLVMWTAITHFARKGYSVLDLGRTSLWNEGLRFYKSRWGSVQSQLFYPRFEPNTNRFTSAPDGASGLHTAVFKKLPILFSRAIGAVLYKHMA